MKDFEKIVCTLLFSLCLALSGQAKVYHVRFKTDSYSDTYNKGLQYVIDGKLSSVISDYSDDNIVSKISNFTYFKYKTAHGIIAGSEGEPGQITFSINPIHQSNISKITICAYQYQNNNATYSLELNGIETDRELLPAENPYIFTSQEALTLNSITLKTTKAVYFSEIIIETIEEKNLNSIGNSPYWATFSNDTDDVFFTSTVDVKTAAIKNGGLTLPVIGKASYKGTEGTYVAKGTGVLLKSTQVEKASYYIVEDGEVSKNYDSGNLLHHSSEIVGSQDDYAYFVLSSGEKGIGFYWDTAQGPTLAETWAGGAYLAIPKGTLTQTRGFGLDDIESGIQQITTDNPLTTIHTIDGRAIKGSEPSALNKGFYIINNNKVLIK